MLLQDPTKPPLNASPLGTASSSPFFARSSAAQTGKTILLVDDDEPSFVLLSRGSKALDPDSALRYADDGLLLTKYLQREGLFAVRFAYPFPNLALQIFGPQQ